MALPVNLPKNTTQLATTATSGSASDAINLKGGTIVALETDGNLRSVTSVTLSTCDTAGGTYKAVKDNTNTAITFTLATNTRLTISPLLMYGVGQFVKLVPNAGPSGGALLVNVISRNIE